MKHENQKNRGQIRGYLFERIICLLLEQNNFILVKPDRYNKSRVRRTRENFTELKGRGGWHQIDCPFDYERTVPFLYPIRLVGEVKYHQAAVAKDAIRNFIGVLRDIQEYYFIDDSLTEEMVRERRIEIGAFFSANGFQDEAERLAYSHGIRTISYKNNPIVQEIRDYLDELETWYLTYDLFSRGSRGVFLQDFERMIRREVSPEELIDFYGIEEGAVRLLAGLADTVGGIQSSFIAATGAGSVFHFLGKQAFPERLFGQTDRAVGHVYYEHLDLDNQTVSYLQLEGDDMGSRFYFTLPEGLSERAVYGSSGSDDQRQEDGRNRVLYVTMPLQGIQRSLVITLDTDRVEEMTR